MDSAGLRWYRTGTVNITQGSTNVIGVGTNWQTAGIQPGDVFMVGNSVLYEIAEVADNTNIVLHSAFQEATGTGQNYSILRNFAGTMQAQIAAQVAELVNKYESYIDTELDQIVGPPGPTSFPYRGTWAAGRQYDALDVVEYQGALYMAIAPHTSTTTNAPGATETEWVILSVAVGGVMTTSFTKGAEVAPSGSNGISVIGKNDASDITLSATDGAIRLQQTSGGTTTTVTEFTRAEITALSARVTAVETALEDTGWQRASIPEGFTDNGNAAYGCFYRRKNGWVNVNCVLLTTAAISTNVETILATLPEEYLSSQTTYMYMPILLSNNSDSAVPYGVIRNNGQCICLTEVGSIPVGVYVGFNVSYPV